MDDLLGSVILDIKGMDIDQVEKDVLRHPQVAGVIFFKRNFDNVAQLSGLIRSIREVRSDLALSVDQEGGRVQRFDQGFTRLPAMQRLGQAFCEDQEIAQGMARTLGWLMAVELRAIGMDLSFAPVLDVDDSKSLVIGDRAFSNDPQTVSALARFWIEGMHDAGMMATGKHFPGHGSIVADSHVACPTDARSLEQVKQHDMLPFIELVSDLDAVMPAHIVYERLDDKAVGFSRYWLQDVLRQQLGFDGVIFSDDLSMKGATTAGSYEERAHAAIDAGCDNLLVCNNDEAAIKVLEALESRGNVASKRLSTVMRRYRQSQPPCDLNALRKTPRWQESLRQLESLQPFS